MEFHARIVLCTLQPTGEKIRDTNFELSTRPAQTMGWTSGGSPFTRLCRALINRFTSRCEGALRSFQSGGMGPPQHPRLLELGLRLGISLLVSLGISFLAGKYLVQFIDPQHKGRQQAKKSKDELMKRLGRPNMKTNEYEDVIAQVCSGDNSSACTNCL